MPGPDQFERELMELELHEDPRARAARLASGRWITQLRLWAAMERDGVTEPGARAAFLCHALYPDLSEDLVRRLVEAVRAQAVAGEPPLRRPARAADTVGEALEALMAEFGYPVEA